MRAKGYTYFWTIHIYIYICIFTYILFLLKQPAISSLLNQQENNEETMREKKQKYHLEYMLSGIMIIAVMVKTITTDAAYGYNSIQFGEIKMKMDFMESQRSARVVERSKLMLGTLPTPQIQSGGNEVGT